MIFNKFVIVFHINKAILSILHGILFFILLSNPTIFAQVKPNSDVKKTTEPKPKDSPTTKDTVLKGNTNQTKQPNSNGDRPKTKSKSKKKKKSTSTNPTPGRKNPVAAPKTVTPAKKEPQKFISPLGDEPNSFKNYKPQTNSILQVDSDVLKSLFTTQGGNFQKVIKNADKYKVQIIFTQIRRLNDNRPILRHHTFNLDSLEHFFPASMVKMPTCAIALEKINQLAIPGLDKFTQMRIKSGRYACHKANSKAEASKKFGYPNLAHYIKDVFVASGNIAYDRVYEFVGQKELNDKLRDKGYKSFVITQRYGNYCSLEENRYTQPISFFKGDTIIYNQPAQTCRSEYRYKVRNNITGEVSNSGLNYTYRNFATLKDLHEVLIAIMMPMTVRSSKRFKLKKEDYQFLHRYMSMLPTESKDPQYDPSYFVQGRMKYLLYGGNAKNLNDNIRIFNKVGMAHGFLVDCAYIVDFETSTEFFLSAVICVKDGVNDSNPDYFEIGMPFMKQLGQIILKYEQERKVKYKPDLSFYKYDYSGY